MNPNERLVSELRQKQKQLGLTDSDTGLQEVVPILSQPMPRQEDVEFYEQMFAEMAHQRLPLHERDRRELKYFQQSFHLSDEAVSAIEERVLAEMGLGADTDDLANLPPTPPVKFTAAPPGATVTPQDTYTGEGSTTPTVPSKPMSANQAAMQNAMMQRLGQPDQMGNSPPGYEVPGQQPLPATQAPVEAMRSPTPAADTATTPQTSTPQTSASAPETQVQPAATPTASATPAEPTPEKSVVAKADPATPASTTQLKPWLDKRFLIPFFGLLALFTAVVVIFLTSRQLFRPSVVDPDAAQAFVQSGQQKMQQGQYQAAIKAFDEALRLNPDDANSYLGRGYARHRVGDLNGSVSDYSRAIKLNPNSAEAFNNLSHVRFDQRRYDDAIKDANRALELNSQLPEANVNLGNAYFAQGDLDRAAQQFQAALQSNPSNQTKARAHNNRGNIFLARNQIQEAGSEYDQAIQLDPQYADAFFNRGIAKERNRDFAGAAQDFAEAAKLYKAQGNDARSREAQTKAERMQRETNSTPLPPTSPNSNQQSI